MTSDSWTPRTPLKQTTIKIILSTRTIYLFTDRIALIASSLKYE